MPQTSRRELFGVEGLQTVRLLAEADEFDGAAVYFGSLKAKRR